MTHKERFIKALKREPIEGHVPHFEMVFFLTMEAFGKVHPSHRQYTQWNQMSETERQLHIADMAQCYLDIARRYDHDAIFLQSWPLDTEMCIALIRKIRALSGDEYFLMLHGDGTYEIPTGEDMVEYAARFYEEPEAMHTLAQSRVDTMCGAIEKILAGGGDLDGVAMCSDYCFNDNPFFSPGMFREFVFPYLKQSR